jgi:hypothetical protein
MTTKQLREPFKLNVCMPRKFQHLGDRLHSLLMQAYGIKQRRSIVHINERKGVRLFSQLTKLREKKDSTTLAALSRARPSSRP